jgi:hypothetical protein
MPKKNMSLDTELTRYHRIGSPTDPIRVLADRPLECAICHADKQVGELVLAMETWWKKAYDRDALRDLYGDLTSSPLLATLERGKPHEKAVALAILSNTIVSKSGDSPETAARHGARRPRRELTPLFARELDNEYPLVREFARFALLSSLGEGNTQKSSGASAGSGASGQACELSMYRGQDILRADAEACLRAAGLPLPTWRPTAGPPRSPGATTGTHGNSSEISSEPSED